jgi:chlorobactene lauroyltransferase
MGVSLHNFVTVQTTDIIRADPTPLAKAFWGRYFERSVRTSFHHVMIDGEGGVAGWTPNAPRRMTEPLILFATHHSWWDAALSIVLSLRTLRLDAYGMMEHKQLQKYQFFRKIGMFSVVREDPRSALRSIHHAADVLRGTGRSLWMFPQGELIQQDVRPISCDPGLGILTRLLGTAWLAPVAFRYEMVREQRPDVFIRIGAPQRVEWSKDMRIDDIIRDAQDRLTSLADGVRADAMAHNTAPYRTLYTGARSMEKLFDTITGKS